MQLLAGLHMSERLFDIVILTEKKVFGFIRLADFITSAASGHRPMMVQLGDLQKIVNF